MRVFFWLASLLFSHSISPLFPSCLFPKHLSPLPSPLSSSIPPSLSLPLPPLPIHLDRKREREEGKRGKEKDEEREKETEGM